MDGLASHSDLLHSCGGGGSFSFEEALRADAGWCSATESTKGFPVFVCFTNLGALGLSPCTLCCCCCCWELCNPRILEEIGPKYLQSGSPPSLLRAGTSQAMAVTRSGTTRHKLGECRRSAKPRPLAPGWISKETLYLPKRKGTQLSPGSAPLRGRWQTPWPASSAFHGPEAPRAKRSPRPKESTFFFGSRRKPTPPQSQGSAP